MRSAWTLMRDFSHWKTIADALPNLREWQCDYAKSKVEAVYTTARILRALPPTLVHLNIVMEGLYSREKTPGWTGLNTHAWLQELQDATHQHQHQHIPGWGIPPSLQSPVFHPPASHPTIQAGPGAAPASPHLCRLLGYMSLGLESVSYTGRVCHQFFAGLAQAVEEKKVRPALRSVELIVKNCCRAKSAGSPGEGASPALPTAFMPWNAHLPGPTIAVTPVGGLPIPSISSPVTPTTDLTQDPYQTTTDSSPTMGSNTPLFMTDTDESPQHNITTNTPLPYTLTSSPFTTTTETAGTGTGISNLAFITAFEDLTLSSVRILGLIPSLQTITIRHIDLDSACPLLNPYFTFAPVTTPSSQPSQQQPKYEMTGLWSDEILSLAQKVRPGTEHVCLEQGVFAQTNRAGMIVRFSFPKRRPRGIRVGAYRELVEGMKRGVFGE